MINLDSSTKLQVILGAAVATNQSAIVASWVDLTSSASTPGLTTSTTNSGTAVDIIAAPASSTYRIIKSIFLQNADTAAITLTLRTNNGGTTRNEIVVTLQIGDNFQYEDGAGFFVCDSNGQIRQSGSSSGRLIRSTQYLTSGSSATYTWPTNCTAIEIEQVGGGAGGGGAAATAANCAAAAGGSSGSFLRVYIPYDGTHTTATYTVGTLGAGGTAGNNNGTGGNDTTFIYNSITYTAKGGGGGTGSAAGTAAAVVVGGSTTVSTNGDVNGRGEPGEAGITLSGTVGVSGSGGSSPFGGGGVGLTTEGAGTNATGYGGGGGGALCLGTTARAGGDGTGGVIVIHEYY